MSQAAIGTINPATESGSALATRLNNFGGADLTMHSGSSRPSYAVAGTLWLDTTTTAAWAIKLYDGTSDIVIATVNSSTHASIGLRLKRIRRFTSSTTYTPTDANVKSILVQIVGGGGGGGGGAAASTGNGSAGGGGSAGTYAEGWVTSGFSSLAITIGAGGGGATAGNNAGSSGGTTSLGSLFSCPGGNAGSGSGNASAPNIGGAGGAAATAATIDGGVQQVTSNQGEPGQYGIRLGNEAVSGAGGSSPFGMGGAQRGATQGGGTGTGNAGTGYGAGGGGGVVANGSAAAGGAGAQGIVIVWEFE